MWKNEKEKENIYWSSGKWFSKLGFSFVWCLWAELGHILSPFLSRNGLVWLVSTHSQHKIFIFSVNAKLSITQFTMSIQDLHSLLIPGKTSTHLIQKPFIFIFRPFLFWHFAVSTKDCNFSNQSCEYFINLLQLKSWVWFKVGAETLNWIVWWRDQSNKTLFKSDVYSVRQNHGAGAREHSCFFPPR